MSSSIFEIVKFACGEVNCPFGAAKFGCAELNLLRKLQVNAKNKRRGVSIPFLSFHVDPWALSFSMACL